MCGRFAQPRSTEELARIFGATPVTHLDGERYNVAPTDPVAAVVEHHGQRQVDVFRWGLVPVYAKHPREGARLINARAETVESSPAFRTALRRRRCVVPADAFYEWRRPEGAERSVGTERPRSTDRTPPRRGRSTAFAVRRRNRELLAFAGMWSVWRDPQTAARLYSCTIITTVPNELVADLHFRMPVILDPEDWGAWLDDRTPLEAIQPLLVPLSAEEMEAYPVSPAVGDVRSEGPGLLDPFPAGGTAAAGATAATAAAPERIWTEPA